MDGAENNVLISPAGSLVACNWTRVAIIKKLLLLIRKVYLYQNMVH